MIASAKRETKLRRDGWRIRIYVSGRLRELYVAGGSKAAQRRANTIANHLDKLAGAKSKNMPPTRDSLVWANGTDGKLRKNLVAWGLAEPINSKLMTDEGRLLGAFLDTTIEGRTDVKRSTIVNYEQTRRLLCEYFNEGKLINSITAADCERWRRWKLARPMAQASVSKHVKRAKTMFFEAVAIACGG